MNTLQTLQEDYLEFCRFQKRLDSKTLKAYRIDLTQFIRQTSVENIFSITPNLLEQYIATLHQTYKPKTSKRKIASLKAF
ncbi:MAG: site-specific integrase, partial [Lachnospiraceae bacterium]|nr:site-specific integrase [Lachnospiraceae bacterium]